MQTQGVVLWRFLALMVLVGTVVFVMGVLVCLQRDITPTMHNMMGDTAGSAPFVVSAVNVFQAVHGLISVSIFYATRTKARVWARVQLAATMITHATLLVALFVLPFLGGSRDWVAVMAIIMWGGWQVLVCVALRHWYRYTSAIYEQRFLKWNVALAALYSAASIACVVQYLVIPNEELWLFVTQSILFVTLVGFCIVAVVHMRSVELVFMVHYQHVALLHSAAEDGGN